MTLAGPERAARHWDLPVLIARLASIDFDEEVTSRARRNARRVFYRLAEQLPAGAAAQAWDDDLLTAEQHDEIVRWREKVGLFP